ALATLYDERFSRVEAILPLATPPGTTCHARSLYVVRLDDPAGRIDRDGLMARLRERNIGTGLHFRAVHEHEYYRKNRDLWRGELPHTEWNSSRILSLPLFPGMTDEDAHQVAD